MDILKVLHSQTNLGFDDFIVSLFDKLLTLNKFNTAFNIYIEMSDYHKTLKLKTVIMKHYSSNENFIKYVSSRPFVFTNIFGLIYDDLVFTSLNALKFTHIALQTNVFDKMPSLLYHATESVEHMEFLFQSKIFTPDSITSNKNHKYIIYAALNNNNLDVLNYLRDILIYDKPIINVSNDDIICEFAANNDDNDNDDDYDNLPEDICNFEVVELTYKKLYIMDAKKIFCTNIMFGKTQNIDIAIMLNRNNFNKICKILRLCDVNHLHHAKSALVKIDNICNNILSLSNDDKNIIEWFVSNVMTIDQLNENKLKILEFVLTNNISSVKLDNVSILDIDNLQIKIKINHIKHLMKEYNFTFDELRTSQNILNRIYSNIKLFDHFNLTDDMIDLDIQKISKISINVLERVNNNKNLPINKFLINAVNDNDIDIVAFICKNHDIDSNMILNNVTNDNIDISIYIELNNASKIDTSTLIKHNVHIKIFTCDLKYIKLIIEPHIDNIPKQDVNKMMLFCRTKEEIQYVFKTFNITDILKYIKYITVFTKKILRYLKSLNVTKEHIMDNIVHISLNDTDIILIHTEFGFTKEDYVNNNYKFLQFHRFSLKSTKFLKNTVKLSNEDFKCIANQIIYCIVDNLDYKLLKYCHRNFEFDKKIFEDCDIKYLVVNKLTKIFQYSELRSIMMEKILPYLLTTINVADIDNFNIEINNVSDDILTIEKLNQCKYEALCEYQCGICHEESHCIKYKMPCCNNEICELCGINMTRAEKNTCPFCRAEMKFI